ncbi:MAG: TIM-barrel domain-containing protein [Vulcanimicrobiota bacterium]
MSGFRHIFRGWLAIGLGLLLFSSGQAQERLGDYQVEFLDASTFRFAYKVPLKAGDYLDPEGLRSFAGSQVERRPGGLATSACQLRLEGSELIVTSQGKVVTRLRPTEDGVWLLPEGRPFLYGLGEQFPYDRFGQFDGDWRGRLRSGGPYGNEMQSYYGGAVGNAQFPVLYAVDPEAADWMLLLDNPYGQQWDFRQRPWRVLSLGGPLQGVLSVDELPALRRRLMQLTGRPPVPPRKAFGLWVSEYGFDDWAEIEDKLASLRAHQFPVDGFVLDLQWFGGITTDSGDTAMGKLTFDLTHFPDPAATIADFARRHLGIIAIEEAYVGENLAEHRALAERGYLVRAPGLTDQPLLINKTPWWGVGGMIDYTSAAAAGFWHDWKRQPLVEMGLTGHWTDLGEPEMYLHQRPDGSTETGLYAGDQPEAAVHNLFAHRWARSIAEGYRRHQVTRRPFILTRTGGLGIQRFGAALWSGDIPTHFGSLASHFNAAMHLGLSGIDYFGSDVGGFYRRAFKGDQAQLDDLYTQWFAAACAFDVPIRPHTVNLENNRETAPDRIGDVASNLENLRERYRLLPYYYSLAHQARRVGDPVFAPVFFYDAVPEGQREQVYTMGDERFIGADMLVKLVASSGARTASVYLPPGGWFDYHTDTYHASQGTTLGRYPLYRQGRFQLPRFVRAGAIIPTADIEAPAHTDEVAQAPLLVKVYQGPPDSSREFVVSHDDGVTLDGPVRQTTFRASYGQRSARLQVTSAGRAVRVEFFPTGSNRLSGVTIDGVYQPASQGPLVIREGDHRIDFELEPSR